MSIRKSSISHLLMVPTIVIAISQLYFSFTLRYSIKDSVLISSLSTPSMTTKTSTNTTSSISNRIPGLSLLEQESNKKKNESFGACLMIKEDNDLLYDWIAYHYTILPLRYLVIGSDVGNTQDPSKVLKLWDRATDIDELQYWILNSTDFMYRHGGGSGGDGHPMKSNDKIRGTNKTSSSDSSSSSAAQHHHDFVNRQRAFITTCTELLKKEGLRWVIYIDSDEYIVMNRLGSENEEEDGDEINTLPMPKDSPTKHQRTDAEINATRLAIRMRKELPPHVLHGDYSNNHQGKHSHYPTILDAIHKLEKFQMSTPCITMPRLLHGALDNLTCSSQSLLNDTVSFSGDIDPILELATTNHFNISQISTLRYHQHAIKGDFSMSKYGKVMMDISRIPNDKISNSVPRNIHRPYRDICGPGVVYFPNSLFYVNHYIGSYERYNSRVNDYRRSKIEWQKRAYITSDTSCDKQVYNWFPQFISIVGMNNAKLLFGV